MFTHLFLAYILGIILLGYVIHFVFEEGSVLGSVNQDW